jgi:uncharacterized membrane protein
MRSNGLIFGLIFVFCVVTDIVYWFTSKDPTGTACLGITSGLAFLISFYLLVTSNRIGLQPMDNNDGEISDGAGVVGHFTASSWWPISTAASVATTAAGLVFGVWLSMIGISFVIATVSGLLFENLHDATPPVEAAHDHH